MKLLATIQKDVRILLRDKVGLLLMFVMPVLLVVVVTSIQNNTFDEENKSKIDLLICNKDAGTLSKDFIASLNGVNLFHLSFISNENNMADEMHAKDIVVGVAVDSSFSNQIFNKAKLTAGKALNSFGLEGDTTYNKRKQKLFKTLL